MTTLYKNSFKPDETIYIRRTYIIRSLERKEFLKLKNWISNVFIILFIANIFYKVVECNTASASSLATFWFQNYFQFLSTNDSTTFKIKLQSSTERNSLNNLSYGNGYQYLIQFQGYFDWHTLHTFRVATEWKKKVMHYWICWVFSLLIKHKIVMIFFFLILCDSFKNH